MLWSLPARGAWIEIFLDEQERDFHRSLPARGAWIEILFFATRPKIEKGSLPARGAWIEIR